MEMQVRSSIQNLVLAFRADVTDGQVQKYKETKYIDYSFSPVTEQSSVCNYRGKHMDNMNVLGAGCYSAAIPHPDEDKVVKVWLNGVDGAWYYISKCWQLQGTGEEQEWMPVIYELGMCMGKPYAVLEKLVPYHQTETIGQFFYNVWEDLFMEQFGFYPNDIHSGNVMYRRVVSPDGKLTEVGVITDPVTEWE